MLLQRGRYETLHFLFSGITLYCRRSIFPQVLLCQNVVSWVIGRASVLVDIAHKIKRVLHGLILVLVIVGSTANHLDNMSV